MTEFNDTKKDRKKSFFHATIWVEFLLTIILVVFLFPSSQAHYAIPDSYPPQSPDGKQKTSTIVHPEKEKDVSEKPADGEDIEDIDTINTINKIDNIDNIEDIEDIEDIDNIDNIEDIDNMKQPDGMEISDSSLLPEQPNGEEVIVDATVFRGNPLAGKKVALTFDDGPYAVLTAEYLKVLEDYQVPAAFFLVGTRVEYYPEIARKIVEKGFEVGSHSYRHGRLTLAKQEILEEDFRKTVDVLSMSGKVKFFRPPYGDYNQLVTETAKNHGLKTIGWNVDPRDWETDDAGEITQRVLSHATDGSVILLHEGRKSTLAALPKIIIGLQNKGYQLVTVSELMK